jgi:hypothetical protein
MVFRKVCIAPQAENLAGERHQVRAATQGPAAAMASCCWSTDCCPVDTRRYAAVLMVVCNDRRPTIHPVSDREELGLACDTGKSDSATCSDLMLGSRRLPVPNV